MRRIVEEQAAPLSTEFESFLRAMPKVELHVHLEGSIRPETLLQLAERNNMPLPATTVEGLREWYRFTDFPHFANIYWSCSQCMQHPEDLEFVAREFLAGQAEQNILHTEATFTALTVFRRGGIPWEKQVEALNRARAWGEAELGVTCNIIVDLPREACSDEEAMMVADWVVDAHGEGVHAFGLGGYEVGFPPSLFRKAFDRVRAAGVPSIPHAGETEGPASIRGAIDELGALRIGHGVRCMEDPALVEELVQSQMPLEVCPTSNVCLGVVPSLAEHPLPRMIAAGLNVSVNSDDPPMFGTTLTDEWIGVVREFGFDAGAVRRLTLAAVEAALLDDARKQHLRESVAAFFDAETPLLHREG
ncbi:MAG: adenosine deaminase [Fimbriimonadaceae bacterium]|nr:adenosine deaminase [Fimbriimonadaceae bacterium]QYK56967.1 MAG: adenosine deaminase [Fimbriimonadaceae bacterium]